MASKENSAHHHHEVFSAEKAGHLDTRLRRFLYRPDRLAERYVKPGDRVLEVGTGSGYQAAVLAEIVRDVYSIERIPELARAAAARLKRLGYANVHVREGDGTQGWPEAAPYDAIMVTAAADDIPPVLIAQLNVSGRLIMPVGGSYEAQVLMLLERKTPEEISSRRLWAVRFVPLISG